MRNEVMAAVAAVLIGAATVAVAENDKSQTMSELQDALAAANEEIAELRDIVERADAGILGAIALQHVDLLACMAAEKLYFLSIQKDSSGTRIAVLPDGPFGDEYESSQFHGETITLISGDTTIVVNRTNFSVIQGDEVSTGKCRLFNSQVEILMTNLGPIDWDNLYH